MRVRDILAQTGLPFAAVAFNNPPSGSYAVYSEEITRRGTDSLNCITEHDVSVEVYSYDFYDEDAVRAVAAVLDRLSLPYKRYDTAYINSEHLYQTVYEFQFVSKDSLAERLQAEF